MNAAGEPELLADYLASCARLATGFAQICAHVGPLMPISTAVIDSLSSADENSLLAFLKRFEQNEDMPHHTMRLVVRLMELGPLERLTSRDLANRAEKLELVAKAGQWAEAVRARNALAREYTLRPDKRAAQVNQAWVASATLADVWARLQRFVATEGLSGRLQPGEGS